MPCSLPCIPTVRRRPKAGLLRGALCAGAAITLAATAVNPAFADEIGELKAALKDASQEMLDLQDRIERLEQSAQQRDAAEARDGGPSPFIINGSIRNRASVVTAVSSLNDYYITPETAGNNGVVGGDFPGSFKLPGTESSMAIYGFIKADFTHNFGAKRAVPQLLFTGNLPLPGDSGSGRQGDTKFSINPTQINIETRTPSEYGTVKTLIEFDTHGTFGEENSANEDQLGIRLAYGSLGPLTLGQDWTAFMDLSSYPETADFEGPNALIFSRVPQVRWADSLGGGYSYQIGLDNPEANIETNFLSPTGARVSRADVKVDKLPDLVGHVRLDDTWGHLQFSAQLRDLGYEIDSTVASLANGATTATGVPLTNLPKSDDRTVGWAVELFTQFLDPAGLNPKDKLSLLGGFGQGFRYVIDTGLTGGLNLNGAVGGQGTDAIIDPNTGELNTLDQFNVNFWYQHWWTDTIRTTVNYGFVQVEDPDVVTTTGNLFRRSQYGVANLFWSPVPRVNLGIEYQYGQRTVISRRSEEIQQVEATGFFLF